MHNLLVAYFVNLYMFRAYLGPSSGGTSAFIQQFVLTILFRCLSVVLDSNPSGTADSHLKIIISTNCFIHTVVPPDDGTRYARNMYRMTKNTTNMLCIKLIFLYTIIFFDYYFFMTLSTSNFTFRTSLVLCAIFMFQLATA